jgi:hypothetical protein
VGLILLGVSICAWFFFYTDLFPEVVGLLGLGGLFAWIAFLSNLLSKERKEELQNRFDEGVLCRHRTLAGMGLVAVVFLGTVSFRGALVVSTVRDDKDRTIAIRSLGRDGQWTQEEVKEEHLAPRSKHIYSLPTPLWGRRQFQVKVSGLPAQVVEVLAWNRNPKSVPGDFTFGQQPILLVHPAPGPNAHVFFEPPTRSGKLQLFQSGTLIAQLEPYRGENVWVGGDADTAIPEWMTNRWKVALEALNIGPAHLARWEPTRSLAPALQVRAGAGLEIRFILPSGEMLSKSVNVEPPYPQEVVIDEQQK